MQLIPHKYFLFGKMALLSLNPTILLVQDLAGRGIVGLAMSTKISIGKARKP